MATSNRITGVDLYIKGLDDDIDEERLKNEFSQFGTVLSSKVMKLKGRNMGCGFITFSSLQEATEALNEMHGKILGTQPLYISFAVYKADSTPNLTSTSSSETGQMSQTAEISEEQSVAEPYTMQGCDLFIKYLDHDIDDERLIDEFSQFGPILSGKVLRDKGESLARGFIRFTSLEDATKAMKEMHGRFIGTRPVHISFAIRKTQLRSCYAAHPTKKKEEYPEAGASTSSYVPAKKSQTQGTEKPTRQCTNVKRTCNTTLKRTPSHVQHAIRIPGHDPLTATMLASVTLAEQKQLLGDRLYTLVQRINADMAGKITGMLLELDNSELLLMFEDNELLINKVKEAMSVLRAYQVKQAAAQLKK